MGKRFTEEDIKEVLFQISNRAGLDCSEVPVRISGRMKSTYGAFVYRKVNGIIYPVEFKFSEKLISGDYDDEIVIATIEHEYIHFLTNMTDGEDHGHDEAFKINCRRLNVNPSTYFTGHHENEVKQGYRLFCIECGKEIARRRRKDSALNIARRYRSSCCRGKIRITKDIY